MRPVLSRLVASILLSSFVAPFVTSSLAVLLPAVAGDLGLRPQQAQLSLVVLTASTASLALPLGRLADVRGHAAVYRGGLALAAASAAAAGMSAGWVSLLASLAALGAGLAAVFGSNNALLVSSAPRGRSAALIGMNTMSVYVGLLLGPLAGGLLGAWRPLFALAAAMCLASLALAWGAPAVSPGGSLDAAGSALLAAAVAAGVTGVALGSLPLGLLGLALAAVAFWVEAGREEPAFDVGLLRNAAFSTSAAAALLSYTATAALAPTLSIELGMSGYGPRQVGALLAIQAVPMAAAAPLAGRLLAAGRAEPAALAAAGSGLVAAALAAMAVSGVALLPAWLALAGLGFALFVVPNTDLLMGAVEPGRRGTASAVVAEARLVGQSLSNALANLLLSSASPGAVLAALSTISLAAAAISLTRLAGQPPRRSRRPPRW